jgi:hypothetical protein
MTSLSTPRSVPVAGRWSRTDGGYVRGGDAIFDNGPGRGPTRGGGRWALEIDGRWVANLDTLAAAKARADAERVAASAARRVESGR